MCDIRIDDNGFPVRPALIGNWRGRYYDAVYVGYSTDGRIVRINVTASFYAALGEDRSSIFTGEPAKIRAGFAAAELSYDHDWMRFRLSGLYATGHGDPYNEPEGAFDTIFAHPLSPGAEPSHWLRQTYPFAGRGTVRSSTAPT